MTLLRSIDSMKVNGWAGDPIDVVRMPDGGLTTVDNGPVDRCGSSVEVARRLVGDAQGALTVP
ncbi:hypothetical protein ACGFX2_38100 [Streptomyces goshikiensis]|uniref:hypothetical protein n=1 Tax=Streptomyces goshikiensis TaxID=1942 RepID=UPI003720AAA8